MKKYLWVVVAFILLGFPALFVASQDTTTSPRIEITGINASETPTIVITANVYDLLGQPVRGLSAEDFTLSGQLADLGEIVSVENLADDNLPFAVVLVIDTSSSMAGRPLELVQDAASLFVESLSNIDTVALVTFDSDVTIVQDFTTDKEAVLNAIRGVFYGGRTALYDAAVAGVETGANAPVSRRAMILLSDGAEFGGISTAAREAALNAAVARGVPVYTIGLGFGTDRTYLEELATGTNARFYESPTPDELEEIYQSLADLFRSQYVITLNADIALDGTEYPFTLQASTDEGQTNTISGVVRAPIPVPLVIAPAQPETPLTETTAFEFLVRADDELTGVEATMNGEPVSSFAEAPYTVSVDPFLMQPGTYELTVTATDVDGDTGSGSVTFDVSALPAVVSLGTDLAALGEIAEPIELVLSIDSQTPTQQVTFLVDGVEQTVITSGEEFRFTIDPFNYSAGEHDLTVNVLSQSGALAAVDASFTVASLPPRLVFESLEAPVTVDETSTLGFEIETQGDTEVASVAVSVDDAVIPVTQTESGAEITLDPLNLPPGNNTLNVVITDAAGANAVVQIPLLVTALAPDVTVEGISEGDVIEGVVDVLVTVDGQTPASSIVFSVDGNEVSRAALSPATLTLDPLSFAPGAHTLQITVTNEGAQTTIVQIGFEFSMSPYLTATPPTPTPTIDVTATAEAGTAIAVQTQNAEATQVANENATATTEAELQATLAAEETQSAAATGTTEAELQATQSAEETSIAITTGTAEVEMQMTVDAQATEEAESEAVTQMTITAEVAALATVDAQAMLNEQATAEAEATINAVSTLDAEATDAASTANVEGTDAASTDAASTDAASTDAASTDAASTEEAVSTLNAENTLAAANTQEAEATVASENTLEAAAALATDTDEPTEAPTNTDTPTDEPTEAPTNTDAPTDEPTEAPTNTDAPTDEPTEETIEPTSTQFDPTSTPVGELTDIQTGTPPDDGNLPIVVIAVIAAILLILLVILLSRRRE